MAYESVMKNVGKGKAKKRIAVRRLSSEGERYKNESKTYIVRNYASILGFFEANQPYVLVVEFTFKGRDSLVNKTWPEKAENRYKKLDVTNRSKLFEDALAEATGVDDSHNWSVTVAKNWARDYEATHLWAWSRQHERDNPIDELVRYLKSTSAQPHRAVPDVS